MITKKEYKEALKVVKQYESEQLDLLRVSGAVCDQCNGTNVWMIGDYINCGDCKTSKKQTDR